MKLIARALFGSHVYGTNTPNSDTDYKSVALPGVRDLILQRSFRTIESSTGNDQSKNTKDDVDDDIFALHYFLKQLMEGQTYALDLIFTPKEFYTTLTPEWEFVLSHREKFLHRGVASFAGYCQSQAAKYSLKGSNLAAFRLVKDFFLKYPAQQKIQTVMDQFKEEVLAVAAKENIYHDKGGSIVQVVMVPHKMTSKEEYYIQVGPKTKVPLSAGCGLAADIYTKQFDMYGERAKLAETNQGVDWKALSHAVRVCREAEELLLHHHITFPIQDPVIKKIKAGEIPFSEVSVLIEEGLERVHAAKRKSTLPEEPDRKLAENVIFEIYGRHLLDGLGYAK